MPILRPEASFYPAGLFEIPEPARPWWVARVRSRQEKGLARHLVLREVGFYLPLHEKQARRAGRTSISLLPLFPGYLFFRGDAGDRLAVLQSNRIVSLLAVADQERLAAELRNLRRLLASGAPIVPHPYLGPGDEVTVVDGFFRGWRGTVLREKGKLRLVVSVTFLRQSVAAEFDREVLAPVAVGPRHDRAQAVQAAQAG